MTIEQAYHGNPGEAFRSLVAQKLWADAFHVAFEAGKLAGQREQPAGTPTTTQGH